MITGPGSCVDPIAPGSGADGRGPDAVLRRGPDDLGTLAEFATLPAHPVPTPAGAVRRAVLGTGRQLAPFGGGEAVLDGRAAGLTAADARAGVEAALAKGLLTGAPVPDRVTVALGDGTPLGLEVPETQRVSPPVRFRLTTPLPAADLPEVVATAVRGRVRQHSGGPGCTVTFPVAQGQGTGFLVSAGDGGPWLFRCDDMRHRVVLDQAATVFRGLAAQQGWSVQLETAGGLVAAHTAQDGTRVSTADDAHGPTSWRRRRRT